VLVDGEVEFSTAVNFLAGGIQGLFWQQIDLSDTLLAGDHTVKIEVADDDFGSADALDVDILTLYDRDFSYNFDTSLDSNGYLSGPALYPATLTTDFATATARQNFGEVQFDLDSPDVSGDFAVELSGDGGSTFETINNSRTGSAQFDSLTDSVETRVTLGATAETRSTATPTEDFAGNEISRWNLTALTEGVRVDDINEAETRGIIPPNTITGETIREAGLLSGSTLLTRHILAEFEVAADQRLASSETTTFTGTE